MYKKVLTNALLICGLGLPLVAQAAEEVNLYSARKEALIKPLLDQFTDKTGIKVNLVTGKADALLKRLQSEGDNSPADILLTTDAGRLHRAKEAGVLQAVESDALDAAIPAHYRDDAKEWYGLSLRARVIMYAKDRVKADELSTYEALQGEQWRKRICIRSSSNIYNQSLVSSLIAANGDEKVETWAKGMVANFAKPPAGGDRDQIKAVAAGVCDIAVANTYYLGGMLHADAKQQAAAQQVVVFWPNQEGRGTHVNVSGAGVTKSAKNKDNAVKLLEFLASDESQKWYAETNHEFPVKAGVAVSDTLKAWGEFKADTLSLSKLGELNPEAVRLMDRAGWR
ncbi:Fe(3+) ABC transporter substrate-binding protein [Candidatus Albibeggiatoa sp. nov. NOAA]|uniref:Fe(3+) ABC transporter substrate-binding protein n=1 Tax=Candidatus Albibeggiatoa sp. nov. NOAA TaxID=3162724 RepID=UPI0032FD09EA|nr:Fe(3+) ABC transporter substrate-binding protein [Thiotrichaceae bacterium]